MPLVIEDHPGYLLEGFFLNKLYLKLLLGSNEGVGFIYAICAD